jgi:hypothetical protein
MCRALNSGEIACGPRGSRLGNSVTEAAYTLSGVGRPDRLDCGDMSMGGKRNRD